MDKNLIAEIYSKNVRMVNRILSEVNYGIILFNIDSSSLVYNNEQAINLLNIKDSSFIDYNKFYNLLPSKKELNLDYKFKYVVEGKGSLECSQRLYLQEDVTYLLVELNRLDEEESFNETENKIDVKEDDEHTKEVMDVLVSKYVEIYRFNVKDEILHSLKQKSPYDNLTFTSYKDKMLETYNIESYNPNIKQILTLNYILTQVSYNGVFETIIKFYKDNTELYYRLQFMPYLNDSEIVFNIKDVSDATIYDHHVQESLQTALEEANLASNAKSIFLSNMSHDIRTPLNAIIGFTNLAIENKKDSEKLDDYLNKISTSGTHLLNLINDILDMSRIEAGKIHINTEPADMINVINDIKDMMNEQALKKDINLNIDYSKIKHSKVYCDVLRIKQVFQNLLSNAIKFTPNGGCVSFIIEEKKYAMLNTTGFIFKVIDNGIGMSEKFIEKLFVPFERERTSTISGIQGTGLGMSICKNIIDLMGGTIECKSKVNEGTTFTVQLGFKTWVDEAPIQKVADTKEIKLDGIKILLVEDNMLNMEIATDILDARGALITQAGNGKEALDIIKEKGISYFDCVLMDIQMPVMDGYEATKEIRSVPGGEALPIVAMTANAFAEDRRNALEAGMNEHIAKPINIDILTKTIIKLLEGKSND